MSNQFLLLSFSICKHKSMASLVIISNFFEKQWTKNHPQYLSGLSCALFPTTFHEIAVYNIVSRFTHKCTTGIRKIICKHVLSRESYYRYSLFQFFFFWWIGSKVYGWDRWNRGCKVTQKRRNPGTLPEDVWLGKVCICLFKFQARLLNDIIITPKIYSCGKRIILRISI